MKDLYVKIGSKGRDFVDVVVYVKTTTDRFNLEYLATTYRYRLVAGVGQQKIEHSAINAGVYGFLCAECKAQVTRGISDGHYEITTGRGLCAMCASTEEIFHKWIENRETTGPVVSTATEYVWKGK